jgi:hypothetical protein
VSMWIGEEVQAVLWQDHAALSFAIEGLWVGRGLSGPICRTRPQAGHRRSFTPSFEIDCRLQATPGFPVREAHWRSCDAPQLARRWLSS